MLFISTILGCSGNSNEQDQDGKTTELRGFVYFRLFIIVFLQANLTEGMHVMKVIE